MIKIFFTYSIQSHSYKQDVRYASSKEANEVLNRMIKFANNPKVKCREKYKHWLKLRVYMKPWIVRKINEKD